jgi:hypothetical protein
LKEVFLKGGRGRSYLKQVHASKILDGQDLTIAARACPELKSFLNTFLRLGGCDLIP